MDVYEVDEFAFSTTPLRASDKDYVIRTRYVYIDSDIKMPGKNLAIYGEKIFGKNGTIDLSGAPPQQNYPAGQRAVDGTAPGEDGKPGVSGSDRMASGSLRIFSKTIEAISWSASSVVTAAEVRMVAMARRGARELMVINGRGAGRLERRAVQAGVEDTLGILGMAALAESSKLAP